MNFRPDIEGLRGVAVLLVVAAHARVSGLEGGYIGVDVFFVLSGYLITGLLVRELMSDGKIRFADFYARRFRRLLPSLLLVVVCTSLLARQLLAAGEQPEQFRAAASAAIWLSNMYFAFSNFDYFSAGAQANLFLHTWSLGIEEQFYLIWPILLLSVGWSSLPDASAGLRRLRIAMPILVIFGFLVCVAWTASHPLQAFYMMPSRAWQFALGATVLLYFNGNERVGSDEKSLRWFGWAGLATVIGSALLLDDATSYPSFWVALPSLGTAAVLAAGSHSAGGAGRLLSLPPMQAMGRISYVWYLWHWPVLVLGAAVYDFEQPLVRIGLVLTSLVLAIVSHFAVEAPLRDAARFPLAPRRVLLAAAAVMVATNGFAARWSDAARQQAQDKHHQVYELARYDAPAIYRMGCDEWYSSDAVRVCEYGPVAAGKTVIAIGDSIGLQWFPAIEAAFVPHNWRLLVVTKSSCPMVDEPIFYSRIGRRYEVCERWRDAVLRFVRSTRPDLVIMGSTYTYDFNETQWREGTQRILEAIAGDAGRIAILRSTPTLPFDAPSCLSPRGRLYNWLANEERCIAPVTRGKRDDVHRWIAEAAEAYENVEIIDLTDTVCPGGLCSAERQGIVVFRDSQHLTASFARSLSGELGRRLKSSGSAALYGVAGRERSG